jgi:magnesium-transporting ATPase (P-type)
VCVCGLDILYILYLFCFYFCIIFAYFYVVYDQMYVVYLNLHEICILLLLDVMFVLCVGVAESNKVVRCS